MMIMMIVNCTITTRNENAKTKTRMWTWQNWNIPYWDEPSKPISRGLLPKNWKHCKGNKKKKHVPRLVLLLVVQVLLLLLLLLVVFQTFKRIWFAPFATRFCWIPSLSRAGIVFAKTVWIGGFIPRHWHSPHLLLLLLLLLQSVPRVGTYTRRLVQGQHLFEGLYRRAISKRTGGTCQWKIVETKGREWWKPQTRLQGNLFPRGIQTPILIISNTENGREGCC